MALFQPPYPPQELKTFGNFEVKQDDSSRLGIFSPSGTEIWDIDSSGNVTVGGTLLVTDLATFDAGITGTGNTGSLTAGSGILGTANTWSALQTFGNDISFGGATLSVASLATNDLLQYNGSNWVNVSPTSLGLVNSVSNSDGTLTISPTTGAVVASLNLGHANTWTALQTFGNNISIGGATLDVVTLTTGNFLYYNGTDWINQSLAAGTGISVSDYTITNTGIISLSAGSGISISGTNPATITNTGALSVSNSDGTLTISPTTGAVVASLNLGHANTWTATQTFPAGNFGDAFGLTSSEIGFFPYSNGTVLGQDISFLTLWGSVDSVGGFIGENYGSIQFGMFNRTGSAQGVLAANSWMMNFGINQDGAVYTFVPTNYSIGVAGSENSAVRNTLDDGSGNMSIANNLNVANNLSVSGTATFSGNVQTPKIIYATGETGYVGTLTPAFNASTLAITSQFSSTNTNTTGSGFSNGSSGGTVFNIITNLGSHSFNANGYRYATGSFVEYNSGGSAAVYIMVSTDDLANGSTLSANSSTVTGWVQMGSDSTTHDTYNGTAIFYAAAGTTYYFYLAVSGTGFIHYNTSTSFNVY